MGNRRKTKLLNKGFVFLLKLAIKKAIFADDLLATESVLAFNYSIPTHSSFPYSKGKQLVQ